METNVAYDVVHANNRRGTQATALQENIVHNANQISPTQTDENEYSTVDNTTYITYNTAEDTKSTEIVLDNKSNTKKIRQELDKNEYGKKWFAILAAIAFVLALLVAVAALVYTTIELNNQMISTNKQIQSMNEQLNNQSSQQIQTLQAQLSDAILLLQNNFSEQLRSTNKQVQSTNEQLNNQSSQLSNSIVALSSKISEQNKHILRNLNDAQSILEELEPFYLGTINNPASSCSDIPQDRPSGEYWIATNTTSSPVQVYCDMTLGTINNPASSCSDISQDRPSGEYWIAIDSTSSPVQVYCDMNRISCSCNTTGGWMRVANLDMTDSNQNCPEEFRLVTRTEPPLRTCGRPGPAGCISTTYSTYGVEYSKVCGRIIAYQSSTPDAFRKYFNNRYLSIDDVYVDGVSLTHGQSPRQHIWTFVNALDETISNRCACPCTRTDRPYTGVIPPFIGQDYFCETGSRRAYIYSNFYSDDPLWDGQGCGGTSTCCEFNNPPWFCKQLPQPTTDNIELRICADQYSLDEDIPIEITELYIR